MIQSAFLAIGDQDSQEYLLSLRKVFLSALSRYDPSLGLTPLWSPIIDVSKSRSASVPAKAILLQIDTGRRLPNEAILALSKLYSRLSLSVMARVGNTVYSTVYRKGEVVATAKSSARFDQGWIPVEPCQMPFCDPYLAMVPALVVRHLRHYRGYCCWGGAGKYNRQLLDEVDLVDMPTVAATYGWQIALRCKMMQVKDIPALIDPSHIQEMKSLLGLSV